MTIDADLRFVHNASAARYELYVADELASIADYAQADGAVVMHHTETMGGFRGRGLAGKLVRRALDDVRDRGLKVVPTCWFVADFIEANPEYGDLLARRD